MPLSIVSIPIGHPKDLSLRALELLQTAELVIAEERKPFFRFINSLEIPRPPELMFLNEHSNPDELLELVDHCGQKSVVLVSDCGTPGFCDPGAHLVSECRKKKIHVTAAPGASSLMTLFSLSGLNLKQFQFNGFLSAKTEIRDQELQQLKPQKQPIVLMDTPYRFQKLILSLKKYFPNELLTIGLDLTAPNEEVIQCEARSVNLEQLPKKPEFIMILSAKKFLLSAKHLDQQGAKKKEKHRGK